MNQKRHVEGDDADLDRPTPPGGPNRTDAPDGPFSPGTPATDPGPQVERVSKGNSAEPETADAPPRHDDDAEQSPQEADRQEENAEESEFGEPSQ